MTVRDDRGDVKQTTTGFRDPRHHICQKQIPIPDRHYKQHLGTPESHQVDTPAPPEPQQKRTTA